MAKQKLELTWFNKDKALIPTETGKYGYSWVSPADPRYCETHALEIIDRVVGQQAKKDKDSTYSDLADLEPQDDNLLILGESGDVLEALTRVPELKDKYLGKVKCIYIDPPFNTAQTFANYEDNLEHSVWLTMMRDRLIHLRELLSRDGSIWVHLDDVEKHRMRVLMDEVFGAGNFQAEIVWQKADGPRNNSEGFSTDQDSILVYAKSEQFQVNRLPRTAEDNARFSNPDGDPRGPWWDADPFAAHAIGKTQHPSIYGIQHPITGEMVYPPHSSNWRYGQETMLSIMSEYGKYVFGENDESEMEQRRKRVLATTTLRDDVKPLVLESFDDVSVTVAQERLSRTPWPDYIIRGGGTGNFGRKAFVPARGMVPQTWWSNDEVGHNRSSKNEIKKLFPGVTPFTTPKPERLLQRIIHIATNPEDIVLDIFAGSGTTAAVAQKMGRRWVTCELVEDTFNRFTKPRLDMVVNGKDQGGITRIKGKRIDATDDGLPEGMTAEEAQKLTSLLNKALKNHDDLKSDSTTKAIKSLVKTNLSPDTINWRGGGSFTVATLAASCFDYDPQRDFVTLTAAATGTTLVESVAANLGFYLTEDNLTFDGIRGRQHLAVVEGVLDSDKVDELMAHLPENHSIVFAATIVPDNSRQHVRSYKNGSRVVHIPNDIFPYSEDKS